MQFDIREPVKNQPEPSVEIESTLAEFAAQRDWLLTLVTDPAGQRFFQDKTVEQRTREYQEQLARTAAFLAFAGNPHRAFRSIHIAGTSGKGSVTAMIAAILTTCGLRTGHHVSPYLQICNEKLVVDGRLIRPAAFSQLVRQFRECYANWLAEGGTLRYGEAWVSLTFLWFAAQQVDWGVVETGMGGRFDPTNVLPSDLAVITNVDFDHVKALGPNLDAIAGHKAGIIKENRPVVTAAYEPAVIDVIRAEAARKKAEVICLGEQFNFQVLAAGPEGSILNVQTPWGRFDEIRVGLAGAFQARNAATAITAVACLAQEHALPLTAELISAALGDLTLVGRLERIQEEPLTLLDGAHNGAKMAALAGSIADLYPGRGVTAVVGALVSKEADALVAALAPLVNHFIVTEPHVFGKPALPAETLAAIVAEFAPAARVTVAAAVPEAVELGLASTPPADLLLITGSLYLVGQARERWFPARQQLINLEQQNHTGPN